MPEQRQLVPGTRALLSTVGLLSVLAGCSVTLISHYDEVTDHGVTALKKRVDGLFRQLAADPVPDYQAVKPVYDEIDIDLAALRLRNELRPKNEITVQQLELLEKNVDLLRQLHKDGAINHAALAPAQATFDQSFRAILKLELEKKSLRKTE